MIRAGIYCRVSTEEQAKNGISLQCQQEALTKFALNNNYAIVDYYIDDGYSGTKLKRPGLQRLLEDVKKQKLDIVLITKLDRWGRGVKNYYKVDDILSSNKVHWKTILEDYDTQTSAGRLHINIMLSIAQNESETTSERIRFVFREKLLKGEAVSSSHPLGYIIENKKYKLDPEISVVIQDIFYTMIKTESMRATRVIINENYELKLADYTISKILKDKIYMGVYEKNGILNENFCPPIVSREDFEKVQKIIKKNIKIYGSKTNVVQDYIFTGLIKCKECGGTLSGANTKTKRGDNHSYRCKKHFCSDLCCNTHSISEKKVEFALISTLRERLEQELHPETNNIEEYKTIEEKIDLPKIDRGKINKQIENLVNLYLEGNVPKDIYDTKYKVLVEKLALADKQEEETKQEKKSVNIDAINKLLSSPIEERYLSMTNKEKRRFWRGIISEIYLNKDHKLEYEFNI